MVEANGEIEAVLMLADKLVKLGMLEGMEPESAGNAGLEKWETVAKLTTVLAAQLLIGVLSI